MKFRSLAVLALFLLAAVPSHAKDPILIIEANGTTESFGRQGVIDFAKDYENNPRNLTLVILNHPFGFAVNAPNCAANCTQLTFTSTELGVNKVFNGVNTSDLSAQLKAYLKSEAFLKPFMRLINSGPGATISGSPTAAIGSTVRAGFQDAVFQNARTQEQREAKGPPGTDPQFSGGFAQFSTDGYQGKVISVTPGFTLDFGEKRDKHLKISLPLARIDLEGLKTYRAGLTLQYLYPFYPAEGWTLTAGPGLSYSMSASADLPSYSGLIGGASSLSLQRDWDQWFGTGAAYYGRFNNLGGIDTDTQANIYGWGAQAGRRFSRRWVAALQLVGIHERVADFAPTTYHTLGVAVTYKILNRFDLQLSINKMFGLPNQRFADLGLGSAWFF